MQKMRPGIQFNFQFLDNLYCHEVGLVCPIPSPHLQHVTNLYISMFITRYHPKVRL